MVSYVFVTVGTTKFDKLVKSVTDPEVINALKKRGCRHIKLQIGNGLMPENDKLSNEIKIEFYRFKESIREDIENADLVISHGGAGCCIETLEAGKPLVAVINEDLMNNHQIEVASKLSEGGYLYSTNCDNLSYVIENADFAKLKKFPKRDPNLFAKSLDVIMGFC
ncbi:UDP-N-acetylglucosamine transferase subunit ALG13 [Halyomorpha halys]|uniref:UDP-N-acetylglucosamine transferase subunit ALG13 n=1 Tax=Halyomorpha halys TaxID=286706 RepID=UPI0006D51DEC|nr:UDP-N-acetylglucosamine transferase subunit ALG13 homolog [Halyomorpha halys]